MYTPSAPVVIARSTPVATFLSVTRALGTASCEAVTVPDNAPPETCAPTRTHRRVAHTSRPARIAFPAAHRAIRVKGFVLTLERFMFRSESALLI